MTMNNGLDDAIILFSLLGIVFLGLFAFLYFNF